MIDFLASNQVLVIVAVLALGAAVGQIPFGPLKFGAAGALFVGLAIGALDPRVGSGLGLVQSVGLALFVYTVGIAAGSTFLRDLKRQWTLMVLGAVLLAGIGALSLGLGLVLGLEKTSIAGAFAGMLTATPALAAASAATGNDPAVAVGYSLGYPVGVTLAIVAVSLAVAKKWPGPNDTPSLAGVGIEAVSTKVLRDIAINDVPGWRDQSIKMSYLMRGDTQRVVHPDDLLHEGDTVLVVGLAADVEKAIEAIGRRTGRTLTHDRSDVDFRRFLVSNPSVIGRTVGELDIPGKLDGMATRVMRGDLEFVAANDVVLQPGDRVMVVVPRDKMDAASDFFGDSQRRISEIDVLATGIGLAVGLLIGLVKLPLPGGSSFALGAAAGPLVSGMVLGALHRTGPLRWDLPMAANLTIRQLGLLLFLATVGLASGPAFAGSVLSRTGLMVIVLAAASMVLVAVAYLIGGRLLGLSAQRTVGAFAGLVGQPAILSYATSRVNDERIESGYAALFAIGIIIKIVVVQLIVTA